MPISFYSTQEEREAVEIEVEDTVTYLMEKEGELYRNASQEALVSLCQVLSDSLFEKTQRFSARSPVLQLFEAISRLISYFDLYFMAAGFVMVCAGGTNNLPLMKSIVLICIMVHVVVLVVTLGLMLSQNARRLKMFNIIAMLRILRDEYLISSEDAQFTDEMACRVMAASRFEVVDDDGNSTNGMGSLFKVKDGKQVEDDFSDEELPDDNADETEEESHDDSST